MRVQCGHLPGGVWENEVVMMQIRFSSGGYEVVDSGQVFLFAPDQDLTISAAAEGEKPISIVLKFKDDSSGEYKIIPEQENENSITLTCFNFAADGTGLTEPVRIAEIGGRQLFLMFWSYLEGKKKGRMARSIKYTFFAGDCPGKNESGE